MTDTVLEAHNISRNFGKTVALHDVSLRLRSGECTQLIGHNASGKTTLLKILATAIDPSSGRLSFFNPKEYKKSIGWAPVTQSGFFPHLTGLENLAVFHKLYRKADPLIELPPLHEIPSFRKALIAPFKDCSSGMKQILNIARAFMHGPKIILLDEPFRNLDSIAIEKVQELIEKRISEGQTVVLSSPVSLKMSLPAGPIIQLKDGRQV